MMNEETPRIQFATTSDGVRIAYTVAGQGESLVCTPGWVSHQELEWQGLPGEFHRRLARGRQLILFDGRGTGLSDRDVDDTSHASRLLDLAALVDHLGLERFVLAGVSQWTPVAISYAAEHPKRIEKLLLYAPFCEAFVTSSHEKEPLARALIDLIRAEWGVGARTTMGFVHPDADREEQEEGLNYLRQASSGAVAARILEESMFEISVCDQLSRIEAPALVMHRRGDNAVPLECGRRVASLLPNVRFVPLEGDHHLTYYGDADSVIRSIDEFLGRDAAPAATPAPAASTWAISEILRGEGTVTILFTDMESSTALTQRLGDEKAQELVRSHNTIVREALSAHGGSEVKHTGDGIMATFTSASRALDSAVQIQRSLARHNEGGTDTPVNVRIGLNAGEPVREDGDIFGTAVQTAARILGRAEPGQILISDVIRQLVAGKSFLFADRGDVALQGFEDPVRLYEVRWQE